MSEMNNVWGNPTYYKDIPIYPVKMQDAELFYKLATSLNIPKGTIQEPEIIKMSYVKFLLFMPNVDPSFEDVLIRFVSLLKMVFKAESVRFDVNDKGRISVLIDDYYSFRESEFPKIRAIIAEQNLIKLEDESYMNPEFRKKLKEAEEFMARKAGEVTPLDQRVIAYKCVMKSTYDEVRNMTIYQFTKELERIAHIKESDSLKQAVYSGMVNMKENAKLPSWMGIIKPPEDNLVMDANEAFKEVSAKL